MIKKKKDGEVLGLHKVRLYDVPMFALTGGCTQCPEEVDSDQTVTISD